MPDTKISALTSASALGGTEVVPGVQSAANVKITAAQIQTYVLGNSFTQFTGPTTAAKTFTLPNASATILTSNAVVTVAQGGIGVGTLTGIAKGNGTSAFTAATAGTDYVAPGGALGTPSSGTLTNCTGLVLTGGTGVTGALPAANGGTGKTAYTTGDLLQATSGSALNSLAAVATGNVLISGGVGTVSSWGKVGLTTHVSGTLPVANGGTNATSANAARVNINQGTAALTDAATIATDASLGNVFTVTLGGNRTLGAPTNLAAGATYIWIITQDGTGSRTLSYNSVFKWPGGAAPTLSTAAGAVDVICGVSPNGTNILMNYNLAFS